MKDLLPPGRAEENDIVKYVKDRCYRSSPLYADDFSRFRRSELYDQGEQWLRRAFTTRDSRYPSQWVRIDYNSNDPNALPLPVYNEMVALRENESARLGRPEYKLRVRPKGESPDITAREGAQGAERALASRQNSMGWDEQQDQLCYAMAMYGGAWIYSYWDQTWMDTVRVPVPSKVCSRNPTSGLMQPPAEVPPEAPGMMPVPGEVVAPPTPAGSEVGLTSGTPPSILPPEAETLGQPTDALGPEPGMDALPPEPGLDPMLAEPEPEPCTFVGQAGEGEPCPLCGSELMPYQPTMEEANANPALGKDWPKGDWFMRILPPFEVFPRDAGIGVDRTDVDEWVYAHVETLDWLAERYPDKVRDIATGELKVHPDHPSALMAEDPTLGSPSVFQNAQQTAVYKNHVLVYEYFRKPFLEWDQDTKTYRKNLGRFSVVAGQRVMVDTTLHIQSLNQPGQTVPRARLEFVPWEKMDGGRRTTVGQSLWDRLFDAADGINERMAQVRAVNQRGALPWYLQMRGRNFETRAADSAVPFRRVMVDIDPVDKQPPLQLMQNTTIDAGVYTEIDKGIEYAARVSGQVEVENGQVPPGVSAATAIAYLKTESGEKRRPRIARIRRALVRGGDHGLQLMSALYIEPREYSFEDEFGEERYAFIHGEVVARSNPKVDIYPTPDYDVTDAQREGIRDMVQLGILNPAQTPQLNRKIVKMLEPSLEFFVDDDLQEEQAEREWRDFKENGKVPVIDPGIDDMATHFQIHGQHAFSAWFREQEMLAGWDSILRVLSGDWDQLSVRLATQIQMMSQMANQQARIAQQTGKPPLPFQPPLSLQDALIGEWMTRIQVGLQMGIVTPPQDPKALQNVLQWRAHMEAHKAGALVAQSGVTGISNVEQPGTGSSPSPTSEGPV